MGFFRRKLCNIAKAKRKRAHRDTRPNGKVPSKPTNAGRAGHTLSCKRNIEHRQHHAYVSTKGALLFLSQTLPRENNSNSELMKNGALANMLGSISKPLLPACLDMDYRR